MKSSDSFALVRLCCGVLDEKKGEDVRVLDVSAQSSITDYMILATGTSEPHLRALRVELEKALDSAKAHIVGMETAQESGWIVVDLFDVMIHLFTSENRAKYRLEHLWKDAPELPLAKILGRAKPQPPARKKPAARSVAKRKTRRPRK
jgi:ribosome-associated protein